MIYFYALEILCETEVNVEYVWEFREKESVATFVLNNAPSKGYLETLFRDRDGHLTPIGSLVAVNILDMILVLGWQPAASSRV